MKKLKILLACAGGMSTTLFCKKIIAEAEKNGFECICEAYGVSQLSPQLVEGTNVILLAPQVRFNKGDIEKKFPEVPVEPVSMQDYGMVNGEAVFKAAMEKYSW